MRPTNLDQKGINQLIKFEKLVLTPYLCPAKVPTISVGCTYYEDGTRVTLKDPAITKERAISLFRHVLKHYEQSVDAFTRDDITQNQFNALVSLAYNIGVQAFKKSTLLKLVNANPKNPAVKAQFLRWNKDNGKVLQGLTNRRITESNLYFS